MPTGTSSSLTLTRLSSVSASGPWTLSVAMNDMSIMPTASRTAAVLLARRLERLVAQPPLRSLVRDAVGGEPLRAPRSPVSTDEVGAGVGEPVVDRPTGERRARSTAATIGNAASPNSVPRQLDRLAPRGTRAWP